MLREISTTSHKGRKPSTVWKTQLYGKKCSVSCCVFEYMVYFAPRCKSVDPFGCVGVSAPRRSEKGTQEGISPVLSTITNVKGCIHKRSHAKNVKPLLNGLWSVWWGHAPEMIGSMRYSILISTDQICAHSSRVGLVNFANFPCSFWTWFLQPSASWFLQPSASWFLQPSAIGGQPPAVPWKPPVRFFFKKIASSHDLSMTCATLIWPVPLIWPKPHVSLWYWFDLRKHDLHHMT